VVQELFSAMYSPITNFQLTHLSRRNNNCQVFDTFIQFCEERHIMKNRLSMCLGYDTFSSLKIFFHVTLILNIYFKITNIYLWRKVVCLFCFVLFVLMRSTELGCFKSHSWSLLRRRGALACFHGVWICDVKVFEYWMISSLKIKLNCSWKFQRIGMCFQCCWKDLDEQD
jgi:hypothetical protein